jgi:hypothetical protein
MHVSTILQSGQQRICELYRDVGPIQSAVERLGLDFDGLYNHLSVVDVCLTEMEIEIQNEIQN